MYVFTSSELFQKGSFVERGEAGGKSFSFNVGKRGIQTRFWNGHGRCNWISRLQRTEPDRTRPRSMVWWRGAGGSGGHAKHL